MLTYEAMEALGYKDLGKLQVGYAADFSLVKTNALSTTNRNRILTNLLYAGNGEQIQSVYIAGKPLLEKGVFLHHDLGRILEQCEKILSKIEERI
jgi:5-methylthioadenosine/S-adenosylhomocysteine deaminase